MLTVIARAPNYGTTTCWDCVCDCGNKKLAVHHCNLHSGGVQSCGCLRGECHGRSGKRDRTLGTWVAMKRRCERPWHPQYKHYGARGITIEFKSFAEFVACVGERPLGMTIDRIDPNGNYAHGNVRWADTLTQRRNRRVPPKLADEDIPRLVARRASGATWRAISREFGVSAATAFGYHARHATAA